MNTHSAPWWASLTPESLARLERIARGLETIKDITAIFRAEFRVEEVTPDQAPNPIYEDESERAK